MRQLHSGSSLVAVLAESTPMQRSRGLRYSRSDDATSPRASASAAAAAVSVPGQLAIDRRSTINVRPCSSEAQNIASKNIAMSQLVTSLIRRSLSNDVFFYTTAYRISFNEYLNPLVAVEWSTTCVQIVSITCATGNISTKVFFLRSFIINLWTWTERTDRRTASLRNTAP